MVAALPSPLPRWKCTSLPESTGQCQLLHPVPAPVLGSCAVVIPVAKMCQGQSVAQSIPARRSTIAGDVPAGADRQLHRHCPSWVQGTKQGREEENRGFHSPPL